MRAFTSSIAWASAPARVRSARSRWKARRCAVLGPMPGRRESSWMSRSSGSGSCGIASRRAWAKSPACLAADRDPTRRTASWRPPSAWTSPSPRSPQRGRGPAASRGRRRRPGRSSRTRSSGSRSPPPSRPRRPRSLPRSRSRAPSGPSTSCPASAGPAAASSAGPSFRHLLHPRHAAVETAHHLAHEGIILRAGRARRGLGGFTLAETKVDPDLLAQPGPDMRDELSGLLLRLLVVEAVSEPEDERRPVDLRLRVEVGGADRAVELLEHLRPSRHLWASHGRRAWSLRTCGELAGCFLFTYRGGGAQRRRGRTRHSLGSELDRQARERGL